MNKILIIDDDRQLGISFTRILNQEGYKTTMAFSGNEGLNKVASVKPDLVILDIRLPDITGLEVFEQFHSLYPKIPVIFITAFEDTETAIGAIKKGAYDFIYKPFDVPEMLEMIKMGVRTGQWMSNPVEVNPPVDVYSGGEALVGSSRQMLEVYKTIGRVSSTDATVLIQGESGTGKELAARAIYNHSGRVDKPFIVINCVAIPETLLESELFGYEKGSFTGAAHKRLGKIEQARGGTIFLDEIGDMPIAIQAKLLRLLQENTIERLGGKNQVNVDVRVIAATNRNLELAVMEGSFREDLYYRLRVVTLNMPPLRERKGDIGILAQYLMTKLTHEMSVSNPGITPKAIEKISRYDWPGNIRELVNTLKKTLIFNRGVPIRPEDITFPEVLRARDELATEGQHLSAWLKSLIREGEHERLYDYCLDHIASLLITEALEVTDGNRSQAAKLLGISRPTLHAKIDKYNISQISS